jgi:FADH2-dependent halogenase
VHRAAILDTPAVRDIFTRAESLNPLSVVTDFSYRNGHLVSPRLVRIGDASGFIDPIFSSGVMLAMTSGRQGAQAVHSALERNEAFTPELAAYEKDNRRRIGQYWEFIENFYKNHFAQIFFQPHNALRMVCSINHVLAGSTQLSFSAWWRLRVFFFLAALNRVMPVSQRIAVE